MIDTEDKIDLLPIYFAGARISQQPSNALPQKYYGDPSNMVRLASETSCGTCLYSRPGRVGNFCGKGEAYGKRCEFYRIEKN